MLRWRLILGVVFVAVLVGLTYLDVEIAADTALPPGILLLPLALTIAGAATREYAAMVQSRHPDLDGNTLALGNWLIVASPWLGACVGDDAMVGRWQIGAFVGALLLVLVREMVRYDKDTSQRIVERLALATFGLAYVGLLLSFVVRLRLLPQGIFPLVSMLVVVKLADIGAYTVGRLIGKHKLAPRLSPGKTWEGFVGGLAFAAAGGIGCFLAFDPDSAAAASGSARVWWRIAVYCVVVATTGVVGDLVESLLKRDFGRKDSSDWMPGFGGVLDLIDSPLLAAPVAWAFWEFGFLVS